MQKIIVIAAAVFLTGTGVCLAQPPANLGRFAERIVEILQMKDADAPRSDDEILHGAGRVRPLLGYLLGRGAVARHPASSPSILSTSTAPDDICLELSRVVSTVITCRPGVIMPALRA